MIVTFLLVVLIAFFDLKRVYKSCPKGQAFVVTMLFAGILAVCMLTAGSVQIKSPVVIAGDLMKSIGFSYPPLE